MATFSFLIRQALLLGTAGFVVFVALASWSRGFSLASDTPQAWLLSVAIVAFYITVICLPVQTLTKHASSVWAYVGGIASGPLAVVLHLAVNTRFEPSWLNYSIRHLNMHIIFGLIGLAFALAYRRRSGPNNSSKPTPLRGAA